MYTLVMVLFTGLTVTQQFPDLHSCQMELYKKLDTIFIKKIDSIECKSA